MLFLVKCRYGAKEVGPKKGQLLAKRVLSQMESYDPDGIQYGTLELNRQEMMENGVCSPVDVRDPPADGSGWGGIPRIEFGASESH